MTDHTLKASHTSAGWTGDCSCGGWYTISFHPERADVETRHRAHVQRAAT